MGGDDLFGKISRKAKIGKAVKLGRNVTVCDGAVIHGNVEIAGNTFIGTNCSIAEPLFEYYENKSYENPKLKIGKNSIIKSNSIIYAGSTIGDNFRLGHNSLIREGAAIGNDCIVGDSCIIHGRQMEIGDFVRIYENCVIPTHIKIRHHAHIYPGCIISDLPLPPYDWIREVEIGEYAIIGAGCIILPGVKIGKNAFIGAGALVTKDIGDNMLGYGVSAREIKRVEEIMDIVGTHKGIYPWFERIGKKVYARMRDRIEKKFLNL